MTEDERRAYVVAEIDAAGLEGDAALLAYSAAMSTGDFLDPDDFEQMVADCIHGAAKTEADNEETDGAEPSPRA